MQNIGILNFSVCNIHRGEDSRSEMLTQGLLGMEVDILERRKWLKVRLRGDGYEGWVHPRAVASVNPERLWKYIPKIIITSHYGFSYKEPDVHSQCMSDLVSGDRLCLLDETESFFLVVYPDGNEAYVQKSISQKEDEWRKHIQPDAAHIVNTAFSLMGVPYLWGGTSAKGLDCSGFVKLCFLLNGVSIPRDTWQQIQLGETICIKSDYSNLQVGDLLFFGTKLPDNSIDRVEHVGIYIGSGQYIHSQGNVHVSGLYTNDPYYDEQNEKCFIQAQRYY